MKNKLIPVILIIKNIENFLKRNPTNKTHIETLFSSLYKINKFLVVLPVAIAHPFYYENFLIQMPFKIRSKLAIKFFDITLPSNVMEKIMEKNRFEIWT